MFYVRVESSDHEITAIQSGESSTREDNVHVTKRLQTRMGSVLLAPLRQNRCYSPIKIKIATPYKLQACGQSTRLEEGVERKNFLSTDSANQLYVPWLNCDTFPMDAAETGCFEEFREVMFRCFLQSFGPVLSQAKLRVKALDYFTAKPSERGLWNEQGH